MHSKNGKGTSLDSIKIITFDIHNIFIEMRVCLTNWQPPREKYCARKFTVSFNHSKYTEDYVGSDTVVT